MYWFFAVFGFLFILVESVLINYIYEIFPINNLTKFFKPLESTIWNSINLVVFPTLIWSIISLPLLGNNLYYLIGVISNIFVSCSVIYIFKYSLYVFKKQETSLLNVIAIFVGAFLGQVINMMIIVLGSPYKGFMSLSVVGLITLIIVFYVLKYFPPKNQFFSVKEK